MPGIQLESQYPLESFRNFELTTPCNLPLCTLTFENTPYSQTEDFSFEKHGDICVATLEEGWLYRFATDAEYTLRVSGDYRQLTAYIPVSEPYKEKLLPLIRTTLECARVMQGVISLHSACVELDGQALCFTASSGTGKSTRAASWQKALGAKIICGDRPSIILEKNGTTVSGAPWDGKEQIYINERYPLLAICEIRRGDTTRIKKLSPKQARKILTQQCFLPMWDTDTAAVVLMLINKLYSTVPVYRVTCGPGEDSAKEVWDWIFNRPHSIIEVEYDMKVKSGFTLRNIAGEHIVMPTGKNIHKFDGTVVLNDVAAFVWEKLTLGSSREDLLEAILSEFDVDRQRAEQDLDALLDKLRGYEVIEEESV